MPPAQVFFPSQEYRVISTGRNQLTGDATARSARGVYGISVAAELSATPPQTLRLYERRGLLTPSRTDGGTRRYSDDDLERLKRISELVGQGINLAGIARILHLETENNQLKSDYTRLQLSNAKLRDRSKPSPSRATSRRTGEKQTP